VTEPDFNKIHQQVLASKNLHFTASASAIDCNQQYCGDCPLEIDKERCAAGHYTDWLEQNKMLPWLFL